MSRVKLATGKKKEKAAKAPAFGCAFVILMLLALFTWFFAAAVRQ